MDVGGSVDEHEDLGHVPGYDGGGADGHAGPDFGEGGGGDGGGVGVEDGEDGRGHEGFREAVEPDFHFVAEAGPFRGHGLWIVVIW
ncbi:MAG: hypothetical protein Q9211_002912 [Gyalolechia sp. 1 TL-2023]